MISTDADGLVIFMNQAAEQMTGWSSDRSRRTQGRRIFAIVDEATGAQVADPVAECLATGSCSIRDGDTVLVSRIGDATT